MHQISIPCALTILTVQETTGTFSLVSLVYFILSIKFFGASYLLLYELCSLSQDMT